MFSQKLGHVESEMTIEIEELEPKVAPDGGETVLSLPIPRVHFK